jgi:YfiH family protein
MIRNSYGNGVVTLGFESLEAFPVQVHVATRRGGVSPAPWDSLNFSTRRGDDAANVRRNHQRLGEAAGYSANQAIYCEQVHGTGIAKVDAAGAGSTVLASDGLVTDEVGLPLGLVFADCVPVVVYDPVRHVLGVVHAGWRGTVNGAAAALVWTLQAAYDCAPADLLAAIGPSIGPESYEVGREVYDLATARMADGASFFTWPAGREGNPHFDLWRANAAQLREAGIPQAQIEIAAMDTAAHQDDFFSHRASGGRCGLFTMVAWLQAPPANVPGGSQ